MLTRPSPGEHAEYYGKYIALVPDGDFTSAMTGEHAALLARLRTNSAKAGFRYAEDKWSIAELVQHLVDAERVFSYRMLAILRGQTEPLPSFDEESWAPASHANARDFAGLVEEFALVRRATQALVASAPAAAWANRGTMSGNPATARAIAFIIAGHERHHGGILRDRYGV